MAQAQGRGSGGREQHAWAVEERNYVASPDDSDTNPPVQALSPMSSGVTAGDATSSTLQTQDQSSADSSGGANSSYVNSASEAHENVQGGALEWPDESFEHALEQFDWVFPESIVDPSGISSSSSHIPDDLGAAPSIAAAAPTSNAADSKANPQNPAHPPSTIPSSPEAAPQPPPCPCRTNLTAQIPFLETITQTSPSPRLDAALRTTARVIAAAQAAVDCARCQPLLGPVDLVCVVAVFQQTAACFNYVVKAGLDGVATTVRIGIGNGAGTGAGDYYEVALDDDPALCKRVLVLDLVRKASLFLEALEALARRPPVGRKMNRSPACLNQLNRGYVQEVVLNFRKYFRISTEVFDGEKSA
ncbi:Uu.00g000590.m01.CDS01 [Anthostomella pinea]|uniref:Uu.00g000590.m01.CDS01 n=1 Tax=Anthostomella pinea TaxID=933095 RepID=A0AAI8VJ68_9PEZI|nr:Uu.00g000590.m01.CDS01 [Anthostomella pinea]